MVIKGNYSPSNLGQALIAARKELFDEEEFPHVARVVARAQILLDPTSVPGPLKDSDAARIAHDSAFVETLSDLRKKFAFSTEGLTNDEADAAMRRFAQELIEVGAQKK